MLGHHRRLGFSVVVLGLDTIMHAAKAIELALMDMRSGQFIFSRPTRARSSRAIQIRRPVG